MQEKKWLPSFRLNLQLNNCFAPNILSIECINLITRFDLLQYLLLRPLRMVFHPVFLSIEIFVISIVPLALDHEFDCAIDYLRLRKHPLSNIFPTVWAFLLPDQALVDAHFTEGVATNSGAAAHDVVHADGTVELINVFK